MKFKMADSDDETLTTFGTPFEAVEEDAPRKRAVPIHEQIATDCEGRRRFHGAFTGGFSAGYFNTVGTKEGWQPSTFVSSRSKKAKQRAQKPEDFMDDDDVGDFGIAPRKIATREGFLSTKNEFERSQRKRVVTSESSQSVIPGEPPLQDVVVPVQMSIGVELLKKMGWKEGQGIGSRERRTKKKVYGCSFPQSSQGQPTAGNNEEGGDIFAVGLLFAPKDVDIFTVTPKDDKHGLGYTGLDPSTALISGRNWLEIEPVVRRSGKRGIVGEAFGVGVFEEDDSDIFTTDHISNYDSELIPDSNMGLHGWTGPPQENTKGGALSIFTAQPRAADSVKTFPPPVVPRNFICTHKFEDVNTEVISSEDNDHKRNVLTASARGEMLGEQPLPAPKKSVFYYISEEDKARLSSTSKGQTVKSSAAAASRSGSFSAVWSGQTSQLSAAWSGHNNFKPFAKDSSKQARYEQYLKTRQGQQSSDMVCDGGLTEWEREREKEEFSRAAALYRPLNSTMAARFTTAKLPDDHNTVYEEVPEQDSLESEQTKAANMKMYGTLTRDKFEWHPDRILCRRFNIPMPYPGSETVGVPKIRRPKFTLGNFIVPQTPSAISSQPSSATDSSRSKTEELEGPSKNINTTSAHPVCSEAKPKNGDSTRPATLDSVSSGKRTGASDVPQEKRGEQDEDQEQVPDSAVKRPHMDLFKAIFAETSSESSESDGELEEKAISETEPVINSTRTEQKPITESAQSDLKTAESAMIERAVREEPRLVESIAVETDRPSVDQDRSSSPDTFGPALPPSFQNSRSSIDPSKQGGLYFRSKERMEVKKEKHKRKEIKKKYSESSDSEDEGRYGSKYRHRRKEKKKTKLKHKPKHREEHETVRKESEIEKQQKRRQEEQLTDDKQIMNKLKNLQNFKTGRRMRAVDFM